MAENKQISLQEFTEKCFPDIMKNTFHADFIKWLESEVKNLPNGTRILLSGGRGMDKIKPIMGKHAGIIVIDEAKNSYDCLIQQSCSSFKTNRCSKQCKLYK